MSFDRRRGMAILYGPAAAAWLVREFKSTIKHAGCFLMHLKPGQAMPEWMRAALDHLAARKAWEVVERRDAFGRLDVMVQWLDWEKRSTRARMLARSMRVVSA